MKAATTADCTERDTGKISIHAAREGGDYYSPVSGTSRVISIHAAREGGDNPKNMLFVCVIISIHAAREGGDVLVSVKKPSLLFQSTPPVKAATVATEILYMAHVNFNPRRP